MRIRFKRLVCFLASALLAAVSLTACASGGGGGGEGGGGGSGPGPNPGRVRPPQHIEDYIIPEFDQSLKLDIVAWHGPAYQTDLYSPSDGEYGRINASHQLRFKQEGWNQVGDAGYNVIVPLWMDAGLAYSEGQIREWLDFAQNAGVKVIISDFDMSDHRSNNGLGAENLNKPANTKNLYKYAGHPAFYGLFIIDEAPLNKQSAVAGKVAEIKGMMNAGTFPKVPLFSNTYVQVHDSLPWTWETQVTNYIDNVKPDLFCYDMYSLKEDGSIDERFFHALSTARYISKQKGVQAWNFMLTSGSAISSYTRYRYCSDRDIRWQTMCYMAYGYDALIHYQYGIEFNQYPSAATIDNDGNPTQLYRDIQKVNREVRMWDYVYKNFEWLGTAALKGGASASAGSLIDGIPAKYRMNAADVRGVKSITSTQDIIIGSFADANLNDGIMLAGATDPFRQKTASVTVEFDSRYAGVMVFGKDMTARGEAEIIGLENGFATFTLEPGDGVFLVPITWR